MFDRGPGFYLPGNKKAGMENLTLAPGARLTAVRLKNEHGQEIGNVIEWMMDVQRGNVVYVIAQFHNSHDYYAIPWEMMTADLVNHGYDVDEARIRSVGATVKREELASLVDNKGFFAGLLSRYGVSPGGGAGRQTSPRAGAEQERPKDETGPSNAYMSEGKGYGGSPEQIPTHDKGEKSH